MRVNIDVGVLEMFARFGRASALPPQGSLRYQPSTSRKARYLDVTRLSSESLALSTPHTNSQEVGSEIDTLMTFSSSTSHVMHAQNLSYCSSWS